MIKNNYRMITILTPTYNRAYTLPNLYQSLLKQKSNFEWLIIDDGSTDNTEPYIQSIINENKIPIRYIKQKNQGKHIAINTGVQEAQRKWIFIVDSDDYLTPDAINTLISDIQRYGADFQLCYRKQYQDGTLIGKSLDQETISLTATKAGHTFKGDLAYVFQKAVLEQFPFPQITTEKFIPELYIWNKISDKYRILFFTKKVIYICEYLEDGYTKKFKEHLRKNPMGFLLFYRTQIPREKNIINKLKYLIRCIQCVLYIKN